MRSLVITIAQLLVDKPESVTVTEIKGNNTTVLELSVDKTDIGKIIGKQGKTAQAIRTIIGAVASKNKQRTVLQIIE